MKLLLEARKFREAVAEILVKRQQFFLLPPIIIIPAHKLLPSNLRDYSSYATSIARG